MVNFFINYPSWISPYVFGEKLPIRWYSIMYIIAFALSYILLKHMVKKKQSLICFDRQKDDDMNLIIICAIAIVVGARIGSCLIYSGDYYYKHPWLIFWPFSNGKFIGLAGMSFHGGVIGGVIGMAIYARMKKIKFLDVTDTLAVCIPFSYTFGRLGNFFNAELYGKVAKTGNGMIFPDAKPFSTSLAWVQEICRKCGIDITEQTFINLPRHPSQLYEALFEGIVAGCIMWFLIRPNLKKFGSGFSTGAYLLSYGLFRFFIEYFRQPDENMGYIIKAGEGSENIYLFTSMLNISTGQILCFIMLLFGLALLAWSLVHKHNQQTQHSKSIKSK